MDFTAVKAALEARGYGKALLEDIFCNNLLRVLPAQD